MGELLTLPKGGVKILAAHMPTPAGATTIAGWLCYDRPNGHAKLPLSTEYDLKSARADVRSNGTRAEARRSSGCALARDAPRGAGAATDAS